MLSWTNKVKDLLVNNRFSNSIKSIFSNKKVDEELLNKLEDILISSDFGVNTTKRIMDSIKNSKFSDDDIELQVRDLIKSNIVETLSRVEKPLDLAERKLNIIIFFGVNGSGKTTTIAKLASSYANKGLKVKIAACDTFRAAAIEQINVWSKRVGVEIVSSDKGDPASVAYRAIQESNRDGTDILFIDSAGRLQNNKNLMAELEKIIRVIRKLDDTAPHHSILVLDGTSGQNTISQCAEFTKIVPITGIVITKLDGTAKAGSIIQVTEKFQIPIHFIGIGEKLDDLKEFKATEYASLILG